MQPYKADYGMPDVDLKLIVANCLCVSSLTDSLSSC